MKINSLIKHNLMRAAMTLALIMTCATAWAQTKQSVTYIDENGQTQTVNAEQITYDNNRMYADRWYYVSGTVNCLDKVLYLMIENDTHNLILCDGATLTIKCIQQSSEKFAKLKVYGQSGGTGKLNVGTGTVTNAIYNCDFALYGGEVTLTYLSAWGYGTDKNVDFNGGKLTATSGANGIGGNTTINATSGWIKASKYGGSVTIAEGKYMKDETGRCYKGTLTDAEKAAVAGKTLQPATQTEYISYMFGGGNGSQNSPYLIGSTESWNYFCDALQDNDTWNRFSGKTVKLGADISITQSAGSAGHEFMGTFDGDGKTLTVDITETTTQGTAPFREINGATIRNLVVTGSVNGTIHAAGLVGFARGADDNTVNTITNCKVATNVTVTTPSGNNYHCGGVVGHAFHCTLNMSNTVYCGDITSSGNNYVGGLQGWSDGNTINFSHCLFVGSYSGTASFHPVAVRNNNNATTASVSHVYYTVTPTLTNSSFIAADGTKTISRATVPATIGDPTQSLNFMNTTLYQYGICYNNLYYAPIGLPSGGTDIYLINNADDWLYFCEMLNDNATWNRFIGKTVKLGANISVTQSAGSPNHDFCGTFDGQNNTLTFTATATDNYCAPFRYVQGSSNTDHAVIQNLNVVSNITAEDFRHTAGLIALQSGYVDVTDCNAVVNINCTKGTNNPNDLYPAGLVSQSNNTGSLTVSGCTVSGTISTDGKYAGGMVGIVQSSANITNSVSSVTINSSTNGDGTHGGFVASLPSGRQLTIEGCVFNGKIVTTNGTTNCGGFLGHNNTNGGTGATITNCLYAPTTDPNTVSTGCATFGRNVSSDLISNCYYTAALGTVQGKLRHSITAGANTTVANAGTATTYDVSGITSYGTGILYDEVLYAGNGDAVSLTLTHQDPPEGYTFNGYIPSAGTLNGTTLTMPDEDVTISAPWTPISYAITYNLEGGNLPTGQSNPESYTIESNDIELVNPIKSGYNFVGWTGTGLNGPTQTVIIAHGSMGIREYTAIWSVSVNYINENGVEQTVTALPLIGNETTLDPGWYVVENTNPNGVDLAYTEGLSCSNGNLNLILCDGAEMTVTGAYTYDAISLDGAYTLTIYGQSQQSGKLTLTGSEYGKCIHTNDGSIVMNGGIVNATADTDGAIKCNSFTMNGGSFSATSNSSYDYDHAIQISDSFTFNGGNFSAIATNPGQFGIEGAWSPANLSWTNSSDSFYVSSLGQVSINIAEGKDFIDEDNMLHTYDDPGNIVGKTLRPFNGCYLPKHLTANAITTSTATLTWEAGNSETQWQVSWSTDGGSTWSTPVTVNNVPQYEITSLSPETTVQAQVKSVCGESVYSVPISITFTTHSACDAPESLTATPIASSATLNWTGYQDSYNVRYCTVTFGDADTATEDFEHSGSMPEGWTMLDQGNVPDNANELGIFDEAAQNGSYGFRFSSLNGNSENSFDQYLISPELNNLSALSFYYRASSTSSSGETFRVGYSTTSNDVSAFTWVSNGTTTSTEFSEFVEDANNIPANAKYFAINYTAVYQYRLYIDNITYTYTPLIVGAWNETNTNVTSPLTISGLTPETPYAWQVQGSNCDGNGGTTDWSEMGSFTTPPCEVPSELTATDVTATTATLSWSGVQDSYNVRYRPAGGEGFNFFEGFEDCDWTLPVGWTGGGEWFACNNCNSFEAHSGGYFAGGYNSGTWLITPMMDLSGQNNVTLKFWYINVDHLGSDPAQLEVYYRIVEDDEPTDWEWLWSNQGEHEVWTEATISLTENLSANYQIGFYLSQGQPVLLDDISVISTGTGANEWQTINSIAATTTTLTELSINSTYKWQVQGLDCDANEGTTEWSEMGTFTTLDPCAAPSELTATDITATTATLSWNGFQDSYVVQYRTADVVADTLLNEGFEGSDYYLPDDWTSQDRSWFIDNSYVNPHSGTRHIINYQPNKYLSTPMMDLSGGGSATLHFWYINDERWNPTPAQLDVYYRINGGDWTLLWSSEGEHLTWTEATISLPNPSANYQIGFRMVGEGEPGLALDDIVVTGMGGGFGEWQNIVDIEATTTTLTGLTPDMPYQWQVRGLNCDGNNGATEWSAMGTFTTLLHDPVAYIDENGDTQQCTDYTPLTGTETSLAAGWYVADDTLNYDHTITLSGDIHLILKDNAVMNVTSTEGYGFYYYTSSIPPSISIYAQSTGESKGQLHVDASVHGLYTRNDITINGGWVEATSNQSYGIFASSGNVIINGGIVEATGGVYGIFGGGNSVEIHGGEVTAIGPSYGINAQPGSVVISGGKVTATATNGTGIHARYSITISGGQVTANGRYDGIYTYDGIILGWTNASDFIYASSFYINNSNNYITLSKAFKDVDGNTYESGPVNASDINGKWLYPNTVSRFTKTIAAHHTEEGVNYGWYLIASPLSGGTNAEAVAHLVNSETPANFDLYRFNQAAELEWENWKQQNSDHYHFNLEPGRGYLYANAANVNLVFAGTPYSGDGEVTITNVAGHPLSGWNLVGNPFSVDAYIGRDFYVLNEARSEVMPEASTGAIPSMEGVFVLAEQDEETVTFSTEALNKGRASKPEQVVLNLSRDRGLVIDRAIVRMGEGRTLPKFQLNRNSTKLYIPQDGTDYAIACAESTGEMPVNFKAKENGTYTLTVSTTLNSQLSTLNYLHLIDNLTGADVDLLAPNGGDARPCVSTYTFTAKTTDYESRFKLVFAVGSSTGSDTFAFISNGNWIVSNEGHATLQVIDVNGRILSSEQINGSISKAINQPAGVYMLRLVNGENVRIQKIVIE